jgi:flagellar FliL protein
MAKGKTKDAEKEAAPHGEGAEGGEGAGDGKKKAPPLMILVGAGVGALLIVGGGGIGVGVMLSGGKAATSPPAKTAAHKPKKPAGKDEKDKDKGPSPISEGPDGVLFYTMPDFVVNLQGPDSRPTYLKISLAFEVADQDTADAITPDLPRLKDMFNGFLRELRPEDLSGNQGSYQLKMEIQRRVNLVIAPAKVNAVLINQMLIQ